MFKISNLVVSFIAVGLLGVCWACQVPVFRYALERWKADPYRIVILHDGPAGEQLAADTRALQSKLAEGKGFTCLTVSTVDARETTDPRLRQIIRDNPEIKLPLLAAFYPQRSAAPANSPAYVESFDDRSLPNLLASPIREELSTRLLQGQSAVWLFLPSGDEEKDARALNELDKQLALDAKRLELPSAEEMEIEADVLSKAKVKLAVNFSVLTVDRNDPREAFLVDALLNSESDLRDYDQPLAFPVFGRGRVLYALVGKGIQSDTIRAASSFIVGPCSCQVKDQNPGFDLLMNVPWEKAIGSALISEPIESGNTGGPPRRLTIPPGSGQKR